MSVDPFYIIPTGSVFSRSEDMTIGYIELVSGLPLNIKKILASQNTASFVKGIAKTYDVLDEDQPSIAFTILEIAIGKKILAQLPAILSTELKLPNDKAQKMAAEIEKDVFGPVKKELDEFLSRKVASQPRDVSARKSLQNVLNLKVLPSRRPQGQLPPKPVQKDFPVRPSLQKPTLPAPHPNPLPEQERGTTPKPRFPLPPKPIRFT